MRTNRGLEETSKPDCEIKAREKVDTLRIEPRASRVLSGCDTITPCAQWLLNRGGGNGWEMTAMLQVRGEEKMDRKRSLGREELG